MMSFNSTATGPLGRSGGRFASELIVQFSPEFRLVAACCIWPPSERRNVAIRQAANSPIDWDRFARVVERQRVAGLVHDGLKRASVAASPAVQVQIEKQASGILLQNLRFVGEIIRLQEAFDTANIAILFMKGITLAQVVYGGLNVRHSRDIDFLVPPEHVSAALEVLSRLNYRRINPPEDCSDRLLEYWLSTNNEFEHVHRTTGCHVELHWQLLSKPNPIIGAFPTTKKTAVVTNNHSVQTLGDDEGVIYLCAHRAHHAWNRLKWLADIGAFLESKTQFEIFNLYHLGEAEGAGRCAAQAMLLCRRIFETPIPDELIARFRKKWTLRLLETLALSVLVGVGEEIECNNQRFGTTRIELSQFLLGTGIVFWIAQLGRVIISMDDVAMIRLPRFLHFLYAVIRVPLWVFRKLKNQGLSPYRPQPRRS